MLKHEDNSQPPTQSAARVRVTPEELAAAVTALQIRKEGQPGTIAIGDAVEELGLDVSPEEVLAEVRAGRQAPLRKRRFRHGRRLVLAISAIGILLGTVLGTGIFTQAPTILPGTEPYRVEPHFLALSSTSTKPVITTLAETPDGKTVYCSAQAIEVAVMSRNAQEARQEVKEGATDLTWPVVKHGKDLYVRGWIRLPLSKGAAKLSDVEVFNRPNLPQLGATPQQVTFKLDLHTSMTGLGYQRLNPDGTGELFWRSPCVTARTYEKW